MKGVKGFISPLSYLFSTLLLLFNNNEFDVVSRKRAKI